MPTIQNYPQSLLDEHSNWHMHPGNPAQGGRAIWPGQPGSGLEFLTFHRTFLVHYGSRRVSSAPGRGRHSDYNRPGALWFRQSGVGETGTLPRRSGRG